jgi:hypothetical protein
MSVKHTSRLLLLLSMLLITGIVVADSVVVLDDDYTVTLVGAVDNNDATSTWTYAVTGDPIASGNGLSHWVLGIPACAVIVSPDVSSGSTTYTTPGPGDHSACLVTGESAFSDCLSTTYRDVSYGPDGSTGVSGLKFDEADTPLERTNPGTHVFDIVMSNVVVAPFVEIPLAVKGGPTFGAGLIDGPLCASSLAVTMGQTAVSAENTPSAALWLVAVGLVGLMGGAVIFHLRTSKP